MTISDHERNNFKQKQITKIQYITMHDLTLFKVQSPQTALIPGRAYVALAFFGFLKGPTQKRPFGSQLLIRINRQMTLSSLIDEWMSSVHLINLNRWKVLLLLNIYSMWKKTFHHNCGNCVAKWHGSVIYVVILDLRHLKFCQKIAGIHHLDLQYCN